VDLELRKGEVHCLLGQNGSGKSTLIKVLAGYHSPESGAVATVNGAPFELGNPVAAHEAGIRFIHQDLALIDALPVVENLALGERYRGRRWLSDRAERGEARRVFESYGLDIDVSAPLGSLGSAQRTMTAIVRALHHGDAARGILVLDEPTASLAEADKEHLFRLVRGIVADGGTVLYVTHRLQEIFEIGDRVTVLRDGRKVALRDVADLDHHSLVELIVGRRMETFYPDLPAPGTEPVLEVQGLRGGAVAELSVTVHSGEIVGVVGLQGSGVDDVPHLIFSAQPRAGGTIRLDGARLDAASPNGAVRSGLAFVPGDRKRLGGMPQWTLRENVTLPRVMGRGPLKWLASRAERVEVDPLLRRFEVTPPDAENRLSALSGGNQQKVLIARWIRCGARALLLEEPTAGVDVGAKRAIYDALTAAAAGGAAVLVTTSDFEEACALCDRVLVMREGRVGAELAGDRRTPDHILTEALRLDQPEETMSHA
jgi:ribose transport system ATP-binding protein